VTIDTSFTPLSCVRSFILRIWFSCIIAFGLLVVSVAQVQAATLYWVGNDGANASVATNWMTTNPSGCGPGDSLTAPTSADTIIFDADCDNGATIDTGFTATVNTVNVNTGYSGTISQARDLSISNTFTTSGGTWNVGNHAFAVTGGFSMNTGSVFVSSSSTANFANSFNVFGGTFTHNSGTLNFSGSGGAINCNGIGLNLVTFVGQTGTKAVSANCNLPLGTNPTIPQAINLTGTLSGSGTLTVSAGTFHVMNGGSLSGFTDIVLNGGLTLSATTSNNNFDLSAFNSVDLNGGLTANTPTNPFNNSLKAPASFSVSGNFSLNSGVSYDANNGTLIFDGGSANLSCNGVVFHAVSFTGQTSTKTINNNCELPLGNDPVIPNGIILNGGRLTGTGLLTFQNSLTYQNGASLGGFSGLAVNITLTMNAATTNTSLDLGSYSPVTIGNSFIMNAPTNPYTLNFTAPSNLMVVATNFTINGGTFTHNNGTLRFTHNGSGTISCNNTPFHLVQIAPMGNTKTISSNCTLPLGDNPSLTSNANYNINGRLTGSGTLTIPGNGTTVTFGSGSDLDGFSAVVFNNNNVTINGGTLNTADFPTFTMSTTRNFTVTTGNITLPDNATLGNVIINGGAFTAPAGNLSVYGNWTNSGGTFAHNNGTVVLSGNAQTVNGSTTFYGLNKTVTPATTQPLLTFAAGSTQTIVGPWTLWGNGATLSLRSSIDGTQWNINPQGETTLYNLSVKDSHNVSAEDVGGGGLIDDGNNTGWNFVAPTIDNLGPPNKVDGSVTTEHQPSLTFTTAATDPLIPLRYRIQVFNNPSFTNPIIDYTSDLRTQGSQTFTVGQAVGTGSYTVGFSGQQLYYDTYYWQVQSIDQTNSASIFLRANAGNVAFQVIPQQGNFTLSTTQPSIGQDLTVTGHSLIPNHTYYLFNSSGGPVKNYTATTYQSESATLFSTTQTFNSDAGRDNFSHAFTEFDNVLVLLRYYDDVSASPLFNIAASTISFVNGNVTAETVPVNSEGTSSWIVWNHVFNKSTGTPADGWAFEKIANNVYFNQQAKYPMWAVTTDSTGGFQKTISSPRTQSNRNDLTFTFELLNPSDSSRDTVGTITLQPNYQNARSVANMLRLHYIDIRPEYLDQGGGGLFANLVYNDTLASNFIDWDNGFIGGIFHLFGRDDLRTATAYRLRETIRQGVGVNNLYCNFISQNNYTDCAFAAWVTVIPVYEQNHDPLLRQAMVDILDYTMLGYNPTYNNFAHTPGTVFWIDAAGGKPQFYWYMAELLGDDIYKTHARRMINFIIDTMQDSQGWFNGRYNFANGTFTQTYWSGAQGWAGVGLLEFRDIIKNDSAEQALVDKINTSLEKFADNMASRPIADLEDDSRRRSYIAYALLWLANDPIFPVAKRQVWQQRGDQLLLNAFQSMNASTAQLNQYGLTFYSNFAQSFPDYYMLKLLHQFYPDTEFFPNSTGQTYTFSDPTRNHSIYQAYVTSSTSIDWVPSSTFGMNAQVEQTRFVGSSQPDQIIKFEKRDMTVTPNLGDVGVTVLQWQENLREWRMTSSGNPYPRAVISFSGLKANTYYQFNRGNQVLQLLPTDSDGTLTFSYVGGNYDDIFSLTEGSPPPPTDTPSLPAAPGCSAERPTSAPDLFQINAQSNSVRLFFTPITNNRSYYSVSYGTSSDQPEYGVEFSNDQDGVISVDILDLKPNTTYYFKVRAGNGCMPGDWSNELAVKTGQRVPSFKLLSLPKVFTQLNQWSDKTVTLTTHASTSDSDTTLPVITDLTTESTNNDSPTQETTFETDRNPQRSPNFFQRIGEFFRHIFQQVTQPFAPAQ